jgi:hypothetical protein
VAKILREIAVLAVGSAIGTVIAAYWLRCFF